jgi:hypothetical protein
MDSSQHAAFREAALELADAVEAVLAIRNRFRRRIEESTLRLRTALAKFRAAAGGAK